MSRPTSIQYQGPELTFRGILLGAMITIVFTAANVYLGLKVGLTFSSAIPSAVISMAALRIFADSNVLENNIVQTQASAAGTLSSIIFILPGLVMLGYWQGFPYWQTMAIAASGGMLGVLFTIPLRHAMVVKSALPYPEGVAAAEILQSGSGRRAAVDPQSSAGASQHRTTGALDIGLGALLSAIINFATGGLRVLADGASAWFSVGGAVFRLPAGFSLALLGAGYLIGLGGGIAMLVGLVIAWGVAVPWLTAITPTPAGQTLAAFANDIWSQQVRFLGAGVIGVASIWTLASLYRSIIDGVKTSLGAFGAGTSQQTSEGSAVGLPERDRDISPKAILSLAAVLLVLLGLTFYHFVSHADLSPVARWECIIGGTLFAFGFGFLIAAACGYMAGTVGSSSSPISGMGIVAVIVVAGLLALVGRGNGMLDSAAGTHLAVAFAIFVTAAVVAIACISNDNLQDLKTGWLVGATPWRQQVALLIGCVVGAAVIPPVLNLLYQANGFAGAMPRAGMDVAEALSAPQATLITAIAQGIFTHQLDWSMLSLGALLAVLLIGVDQLLRRFSSRARLPVLAVGIGIYLPPTISVPLVVGAVLSYLIERAVTRRARQRGADAVSYRETAKRRGVLLASGLIVGESLMGVMLAGAVGITGNETPLALADASFAGSARWLGLLVFMTVCVSFARRVARANDPAAKPPRRVR
ncbi:MAG: OPT family oligopeptide transporter [Janthinobacterium lividum]